ncbi:MAG TPA: hypothetical protein VFK27_06865, partial [Bacillales bacterium]|nr:hypothetical protein [Bacillales bacterium]
MSGNRKAIVRKGSVDAVRVRPVQEKDSGRRHLVREHQEAARGSIVRAHLDRDRRERSKSVIRDLLADQVHPHQIRSVVRVQVKESLDKKDGDRPETDRVSNVRTDKGTHRQDRTADP